LEPLKRERLTARGEEGFDAERAELFEAIGHPNRIKIIEALGQGKMGFAELKKMVGMESSGHLAFHLGKLEHLVTMEADGLYALTGDGREALRMIQTVEERSPRPGLRIHFGSRRAVFALLVVLLVAVSTAAVVQQLEIAGLTARPAGAVSLNGRYYWTVTIPLQQLPAGRNFSLLFHGVNFTLVPAGVGSLATGASVVTPAGAGSSNLAWVLVTTRVNGNQTVRILTFNLPPIAKVLVTFRDGVKETISPFRPMVFPDARQNITWFSSHGQPQAAVVEGNGVVSFYVSVSN